LLIYSGITPEVAKIEKLAPSFIDTALFADNVKFINTLEASYFRPQNATESEIKRCTDNLLSKTKFKSMSQRIYEIKNIQDKYSYLIGVSDTIEALK